MPQDKRGSKCPNCHNPFTRADALRPIMAPTTYPPILTGCDVCHSLWAESKPVADSERV